MTDEQTMLLKRAEEAAAGAYAPYSKFRVGAAVLAGGTAFEGVNVENASSNLGVCAERVAISHALMHTDSPITGIAVACIDATDDGDSEIMPCGGCRQWMVEHLPDAWVVILGHDEILHVQDLIPRPFKLDVKTRP